jgi:hypothetical protein
MTASDDQDTRCATEFLDSDSPVVRRCCEQATAGAQLPVDRAVRLFYRVRDGIHYDVYGLHLSRPAMRASAIIERGVGCCIHKSIVYAAALRCAGIPSRLAFSDVRNHLSTARLRALIGGDVFRYHAHVELQLEGRWIRATPVFNASLCRLFGVRPLEFDGREDAVLQPCDEQGRRYLESVQDHGSFADFPYEQCMAALRRHHPQLFVGGRRTVSGDLGKEAG